jgi:large subunit ribosomal protein L20
MMAHKRHKKLLNQAKGFQGSRSRRYAVAKQSVMKALSYAFRDRRARKRDFRRLWIIRINAAARMCGVSYSRLINALQNAGIVIDRKMLADLAVHDMAAFRQIAERALTPAS